MATDQCSATENTLNEKLFSSTTLVLLLCGLPGAGKSTLSSYLRHEMNDEFGDISVIEYDQVEESLLLEKEETITKSEEEVQLQAWRQSRKHVLDQVSTYVRQSDSDTDSMKRLLLLDDNFYLRSMRKQVYQTCRTAMAETTQRRISFAVVLLDTPLPVCLERNRQRARSVPESILTAMHNRFEVPTTGSLNWERAVYRLDGTCAVEQNVVLLRTFLQDLPNSDDGVVVAPPSLEAEQERLAQERAVTASSVVHTADQFLRICVQTTAQLHSRAGKTANGCRKAVLMQVKDMVLLNPLDLQSIQDSYLTAFLQAISDEWWTKDDTERLRELLGQAQRQFAKRS